MNKKIALAGTPNSGKTTLWNLATGHHEKTGNRAGVTTERFSAPLKNFPNTELVDLPGMYSLSSGNPEEYTAINYLKSKEIHSLIIVIDGTKPEQGLFLALQLFSLCMPSVIAINFADELRAQGVFVDAQNLSSALGIPVFLISASKNTNVRFLLSSSTDCSRFPSPEYSNLSPKACRESAFLLSEKYFSHIGSNKNEKSTSSFPAFFVFLMLAAFACISFTVLNPYITKIFEHAAAISAALMNYLRISPTVKSILIDGIFPGISCTLSFLPELTAIFFSLAFLEETGYMARFTFVSDFLFKKIGLSGRSAVPLLLGFGCTVPAVYAAKSTDSEYTRNNALSMLMFVPCSAKFPVTVLICKTFFPKAVFISVFLFCFLVILLGIILSFIQNRSKNSEFILEIPPLRVPSTKSILKTTFRRLRSFISKASGMVVLTSLLFFVLKNYSVFLEPVSLQSESALSSIGTVLTPIFAPTGIPFEGAAALFCGLFAKESSLFALMSLSDNISSIFSSLSAVSFLLFFLIYSPCSASLIAIHHEFGAKKAIWIFLRQIAIAYFVSFVFYQFAMLIQNIFIP